MILRPFLLAVLIMLSTAALAAEPRFFRELNDIPLMPGLYELAQSAVIFDKPEGRIVEAAAVSETENINKIKAFYDSVLPQLGWVSAGGNVYTRAGESLKITVEVQGGLNTVRLMVSPR